MERFRRKKDEMERTIAEEQARRPPNPALSAQETVKGVLESLRRPHDPQRDFGILVLLESSTQRWRRVLCQAVGDPFAATNKKVAPALEVALGRPSDQFRILLGLEDEGYVMDFPTETLDYGDGTCWVECRL
jgi:hypothetical protein